MSKNKIRIPSVEIEKNKNTYPYNVLYNIFLAKEQDKFPVRYATNIKSLISVLGSMDAKFNIGIIYYKYGIPTKEIAKSIDKPLSYVLSAIDHVHESIRKNSDAIYEGFTTSKLGKEVAKEFINIGIDENTIKKLNNCDIYSINDIDGINNIEELVERLSKLDINDNAKVIASLLMALNKNGYSTSRFGYFGNKVDHKLTDAEQIKMVSISEQTKRTKSEKRNRAIEYVKQYLNTPISVAEFNNIRKEFSRYWIGIPEGEEIRRPISVEKMSEYLKKYKLYVKTTMTGYIIYDDTCDVDYSPQIVTTGKIIRNIVLVNHTIECGYCKKEFDLTYKGTVKDNELVIDMDVDKVQCICPHCKAINE